MDTKARLAIFAIMEKNHGVMQMETGRDVDREATRHGGLGCGSIPSVSIKHRTDVGASDKIERMPIT